MNLIIMGFYVGGTALKEAYLGAARSPSSNTILYLPLSNNINDTTGHYTITQSGTVSKGSIGYSFNNGMLQTSTSFAGPTSGTISVWEKQTSRYNDSCIASKFQSTAPYHFLGIKYSSQSSSSYTYIVPEYSVTGGSNPIGLAYHSTQPLNTWLHLVITHGSGGTKFYINSTLVASDNNTANLLTTSSPFVVGSNIQYNQYFIGEISNVIYESGVWSATDVGNYFNATKSIYGVS